MEGIKDKRLASTINKSIKFLSNNQNINGSISLNEDTRWDVWETVNSYLAIYFANKNEKKILTKSLNFIESAKRNDGSFCHNVSFKKGDYCMETTPLCLFALSTAKKDIESGLEFIFSKQKQNGSWEIGNPGIIKYKDWPSVSGFILCSLLFMNIKSDKITKGIDFILSKQKSDGSWGSHWVYYDTPYYPIHVILLMLKKAGFDNSPSFKNAVKYIIKKQNADGSWGVKNRNRPSKNLRTSLALNSLIISNSPHNKKRIEKGINWLLNTQKSDGSWDGGMFVGWPGKKEDIFTTTTVIRMLNKYRACLREENIENVF